VRRYSRRQMGESPIAPSFFSQQLDTYKEQLIKTYTDKARAIAERESLRYKYVTEWRAKLESTFNAIISDAFNLNNSKAASLVPMFFNIFKSYTPMLAVNGATVTGYAQSTYYLGLGYANREFHPELPDYTPLDMALSPMTFFFSKWNPNMAINPSEYISQNFVNVEGHWYWPNPNGWGYRARLPLNSSGLLDSNIWNSLGASTPQADKDALASAILPLFSKEYTYGSLINLVAEGDALLNTILGKTRKVFQLQAQLAPLEKSVTEFVADYNKQSAGSVIEAGDVFRQLQEASKQANAMAVKTAIEANKAPEVVVPEAIPVTQKSKLPLVAGAAALALLLLGGNK